MPQHVTLGSLMIGLNGSTVEGEANSLGRQLALYLANDVTSRGVTSIKYHDWASALWNGESLTLDEADYRTLKQFVENCDNMSVLLRAQLLKAL